MAPSTEAAGRDPDRPLLTRLAEQSGGDPDALLEGFLDYAEALSLSLYDHQEEALLALFAGHNVILNTPTGSGKSLVARALHFKAIAEGKRAYYTAPIKALVSEKFFALCRALGPSQVGMMTGDASVNRDAPIICCTAEILSNLALREGPEAEVDYVVMDEFHYYSDRERGVAWQVPLLTLPQATFLLMSATMGRVAFFEEKLRELTDRPVTIVRSTERPVPLDYAYSEEPLHEAIARLYTQGRAPIYIVHFTQREAAEQAQKLMSVDFLDKEHKQAIRAALGGFRFDTPFGKDLGRFVKHGVGVHHAGLLPKYRLMVEKLAQAGLLVIICGTDTLGVGVNVPIRSVLFTKLCKYDGKKTGVLSVRDFQQIAGRAGRKGFDEQGSVIAQAPEHVVENKKLRDKAGEDPKKLRKIKYKKAPDKRYAHWDEDTFRRLIESDPEPLESSFLVSHGMLLQLLDGRPEGCLAIKRLLRGSHERRHSQRRHARTAIAMFRSLLETGVVEIDGSEVRVNAELQVDFSLNRSLSLYALEAIEALDREDPDYAFDAISLVEATLEDPKAILYRQLDKLKGERIAELKAEGMEYDDRMEELDKVEIHKPNADFIYQTFNLFKERNPWVGTDNIRPKSIARDLLEKSASFTMYVREYGLSRSEGLLLRHLSHTYKALVQNIPESAKTEELYDLTETLYEVVRRVDSSLIDEWEKLRDPERVALDEEPEEEGPLDVTADRKAFTVMVRNALFRIVRALARGEWEAAAELTADGTKAVEGAPEWSPEALEEALAPYREEHSEIRVDPAARAPRNTQIREREGAWEVEQILLDPEDSQAHRLFARVDLEASREAEEAVITLLAIGEHAL